MQNSKKVLVPVAMGREGVQLLEQRADVHLVR
jgi:hypothetical protein